MQLNYTSKFRKTYAKLSKQNQQRVQQAVQKFKKNPFDPSLQNHMLKGAMKGKRSISAARNLRIIFREEEGHVVIFLLKVGTHEEVYE